MPINDPLEQPAPVMVEENPFDAILAGQQSFLEQHQARMEAAQQANANTGIPEWTGRNLLEGALNTGAAAAGLVGASDTRKALQEKALQSKETRGAIADSGAAELVGSALESTPMTVASFLPAYLLKIPAARMAGNRAHALALSKGMTPIQAQAAATVAAQRAGDLAARVGMAGSMGVLSTPDAYDQAKEAGQSDGKALANAIASMFVEGGMSLMMPKGVEGAMLGNGAKNVAAQGFKKTAVNTGKKLTADIVDESVEEGLTEVAHIAHESALGVSNGALGTDENLKRVGMATGAGGLMGPGFNAPGAVSDLWRSMRRPVAPVVNNAPMTINPVAPVAPVGLPEQVQSIEQVAANTGPMVGPVGPVVPSLPEIQQPITEQALGIPSGQPMAEVGLGAPSDQPMSLPAQGPAATPIVDTAASAPLGGGFEVGQVVQWSKGKKKGEQATIVAVRPDGRVVVRLANGKVQGEKDGITPGNLEVVNVVRTQGGADGRAAEGQAQAQGTGPAVDPVAGGGGNISQGGDPAIPRPGKNDAVKFAIRRREEGATLPQVHEELRKVYGLKFTDALRISNDVFAVEDKPKTPSRPEDLLPGTDKESLPVGATPEESSAVVQNPLKTEAPKPIEQPSTEQALGGPRGEPVKDVRQAIKDYRLPSDMAKAAPRYKDRTLVFHSDFDKAAYIVANTKTASKGEARILESVGQIGVLPKHLREYGRDVIKRIKKHAEQGGSGDLIVTHGVDTEPAPVGKPKSDKARLVPTRDANGNITYVAVPIEPEPTRTEAPVSAGDVGVLPKTEEAAQSAADGREGQANVGAGSSQGAESEKPVLNKPVPGEAVADWKIKALELAKQKLAKAQAERAGVKDAKAEALARAKDKLLKGIAEMKKGGTMRSLAGPELEHFMGAMLDLADAGIKTFQEAMATISEMVAEHARDKAFQEAMGYAWDAAVESAPKELGLEPRAVEEVKNETPSTPAVEPATPGMPDTASPEPAPDVAVEPTKEIVPTTNADVKPSVKSKSMELVEKLQSALDAPLSWQQLLKIAEGVYGGTIGKGDFAMQDVYEALQAAINKKASEMTPGQVQANDPAPTIKALEELAARAPAQSVRSEEQQSHQQFSTPPAYAMVVNWVANVKPGEVYLEPNEGTGSLSSFGFAAGAKVVGNELSKRRSAIAGELFPHLATMTENTDHLAAILATRKDIPAPSVVVMNPPFSATAGKTGKKDILTGARHIRQALEVLQPGGRLVAIVGEGMDTSAKAYAPWFNEVRQIADLKANILVDGKVYGKFGTNFGTRVLVFDKLSEGAAPTTVKPATGSVATIGELATILEGTRNERRNISTHAIGDAQQGTAQRPGSGTAQGSQASVEQSGGAGSGNVVSTGKPEVDGGRGGSVRLDDANPGKPGKPTKTGDATVGAAPVAGKPDGSRDGRGGNTVNSDPGGNATATSGLDTKQAENAPIVEEGDTYAAYRPSVTIEGAKTHPAKLVESQAMASVQAPVTTYKPNLPDSLIKSGALSDAQLEQVIRAGQAQQEIMPDGQRLGYMVGDGTGVGKGRTIAGIILDNKRQGRKKSIWISKNPKLFEDAKRDWAGMGENPADVKMLSGANKPIEHDGIIYATYGTLAAKSAAQRKVGKVGGSDDAIDQFPRIRQLVDWLGKDFDGVIAFDESHQMANAEAVKGTRGTKKPSERAIAGMLLQQALPKARVVYVSATGATEVSNLGYAKRLGLWGEGTSFADVKNFINKIGDAGIAAMEMLARDLKSMGRYLARSISFQGVKYDRLTHELTPEQTEIYNELAKAWQLVLHNINAALTETNGAKNTRQKSAALSAFWGAQQRFFNQVMTSMQMPSVLRSLETDLQDGKAPIIQLVNTNEAQTEKALKLVTANTAKGEELDLDNLDLTPRDMLIKYIENGFPTVQFEKTVDANGNESWTHVVDSNGKPVENPKAVKARDDLIQKLKDIRTPDAPMDQIITTFGPNAVAEVTGRSRRVVAKEQSDGTWKNRIEKRSEKIAKAEATDFQNDKRKILIFSDAGGTGQSYHADKNAKNQRVRRHYVLQPGWRADNAMQGLGRSHRTNQAQPPEFVLVSTNLSAQKRFISSIARRLDQLGALTKGQRKAGSGGLFTAADNLESEYAAAAIDDFVRDLHFGDIPDIDPKEYEEQTGLELFNKKTGKIADISIKHFLNRMLSLTTDVQNKVFDAFSDRLNKILEKAKEDGRLDVGLETLRADKIEELEQRVINVDPSGAKTIYHKVKVSDRFKPMSFDDAVKSAKSHSYFNGKNTEYKPLRFMMNDKTGRIFIVKEDEPLHKMDGSQSPAARRWSIYGKGSKESHQDVIEGGKLSHTSEENARKIWEEEVAKAPEFKTHEKHLIGGALLPVWSRLSSGYSQVVRAQLDDGRSVLGRVIPPSEIAKTLEKFGGESGKKLDIPTAMQALDDGKTVILANGWKITQKRVGNELRKELMGKTGNQELEAWRDRLKGMGVIAEYRNYNWRYFVPDATALERIAKSHPLAKILESKIGDDEALNSPQRSFDQGGKSKSSKGMKNFTGEKIPDGWRLFYRRQDPGMDIRGHQSETSNDEITPGIDVWINPSEVIGKNGLYGDEVLIIAAPEYWDNNDVEGVRIDPEIAKVIARFSLSEFWDYGAKIYDTETSDDTDVSKAIGDDPDKFEAIISESVKAKSDAAKQDFNSPQRTFTEDQNAPLRPPPKGNKSIDTLISYGLRSIPDLRLAIQKSMDSLTADERKRKEQDLQDLNSIDPVDLERHMREFPQYYLDAGKRNLHPAWVYLGRHEKPPSEPRLPVEPIVSGDANTRAPSLAKALGNLKAKLKEVMKGPPNFVESSKMPKEAEGSFSPSNLAIRTRWHNQLDTVAHELGHAIDSELGLTQLAESDEELRRELMRASQHGTVEGRKDRKLAEGVAENIRAMIVAPMGAQARAPHFVALMAQHPEILGAIAAYGADVRAFAGASGLAKIAAVTDTTMDAIEREHKALGIIPHALDAIGRLVGLSKRSSMYRASAVPGHWSNDRARMLGSKLGAIKERADFLLHNSDTPMVNNWKLELILTGKDPKAMKPSESLERLLDFQRGTGGRTRAMMLEHGLAGWNQQAGRWGLTETERAEMEKQQAEIAKMDDGEEKTKAQAELDAESDLRSRMTFPNLVRPILEAAGDVAGGFNRLLDIAHAYGTAQRADEIATRFRRRADAEIEAVLMANEDTLKDKADPVAKKKAEEFVANEIERIKAELQAKIDRLTGAGGGIESSDSAVQQALQDFEKLPEHEKKAIAAYLDRYRMWADWNLYQRVEAGLMTGETAAKIRQANKHYMDWHRVFATADSGLDGQVEGSTRTFHHPLVSLLKATEATVSAVNSNQLKQMITAPLREMQIQKNGIALSELGLELSEEDAKKARGEQNGFHEFKGQPARVYSLRRVVVEEDEDGKPTEKLVTEHWVFDPATEASLEAMRAANDDHPMVAIMNSLNALQRASIVLSPSFRVRSLFRDNLDRMMVSESGTTKKGLGDWFSGKTDSGQDLQEAFDLSGASLAGYTGRTRQQIMRDVLQEVMHQDKGNSYWFTPKGMIDAWSRLGEKTENVARTIEFATAMRKLREEHPDWSQQDLALESAHRSRGLMDTAMKGHLIGKLNGMTLFLNASLKGMAVTTKLVRMMIEAKKNGDNELAAKLGAAVAFRAGMMAAGFIAVRYMVLGMNDDDKQKELMREPGYVRDYAMRIDIPGMPKINIAKPYEWGWLTSGAERLADAAWAKSKGWDAEAARQVSELGNFNDGWGGGFWKSVAPVKMQDFGGSFMPVMETAFDKNLFTGRPIVGREKVLDVARRTGDDRASKLGQGMQWLSANSVDARNFDHLINGYLGGFGRIGTSTDLGQLSRNVTGAVGGTPSAGQSRDVSEVLDNLSSMGLGNSREAQRIYKALKAVRNITDEAKALKARTAIENYAAGIRASMERNPAAWERRAKHGDAPQ